jgi:hypothetical protein
MNYFNLELENDELYNHTEFVKFCVDHQQQAIVINVENEGHCLRYTGVYDILDLFNFESVKLVTSNAIEKHSKYNIDNRRWIHWLKTYKDFDFDHNWTWSGEKIFGCFYGRPCAPRLGVASHLAKYHSNRSFIQVAFDFDNEDKRKNFDLKRLFAWEPAAIDRLSLLPNYKGDHYYVPAEYRPGNPMIYHYKDLLIDIVSEPTCYGTAFYPTEKVVRAILCRRPFIVMGSKNYLIYLRQMGFKTFYEFWDEDYDGFDGKEKYLRILKLIDQIANRTDMDSVYMQMSDILDHNFKLLTTQTYNKTIEEVDD